MRSASRSPQNDQGLEVNRRFKNVLEHATTISFFIRYFTGERTTVTDALGMTWRTGDIYETSVLVTIYGMVFIAALALLRITQQRAS